VTVNGVVLVALGFRVERVAAATPERVYEILCDVPGFRNWAPLFRYSRWVEPGTPDGAGAGAVRQLGVSKKVSVDEEIVEAHSPHYQRYVGVRGFPVSHYGGEIRLGAVEAGSHLLWTVSFVPLVPGTGWPLRWIFRSVITYLVDHLISEAEKSTGLDAGNP